MDLEELELELIDHGVEEVFEDENQKDLFDDYKKLFESDKEVLIRNQFHVSDSVLKKQKQISFNILVSSSVKGAPASPSIQQAPLHADKLHTKSFSIMSSETIVFPN